MSNQRQSEKPLHIPVLCGRLWLLLGRHLGESFHVVADDLRVRTLQFADDFKALIELGEHVHHRAGEQSVL